MGTRRSFMTHWLVGVALATGTACRAAENPYLYGIHDTDPPPTEFLNHVKAQVSGSWLTATVAVGHNPNDNSGVDFSAYANQGHTVICRINNGYCGSGGTIPLPDQYANFAQRCANFVTHSPGCTIWVIGNETNLASEWPPSGNHLPYVSPQSYAQCFRACYDAIKAVRPTHRVVTQALAPWGGPYGAGTACGCTHDAMPLNWVQYLNQMLTAIRNSGGIDGIALHVPSRGYSYADIHSQQKINAGGQYLYWSFYCYKDWLDLGIPPELYHLPVYITECNGNYYWKGGHPEDPARHYEAGWVQEVLRELNAYNQYATTVGKPIFRCVNFYRWCSWCDGWNIDGADNPYKSQILSDLDAALTFRYTWPVTAFTTDPPAGAPLAPAAAAVQTDSYQGTQPGWAASDGVVSESSKWVSSSDPPPHWIALDLGAGRTVTGFIVRLPGAAGEPVDFNATAFDFQIAASLAGPWTTETSIDNGARANVVARSYVTPKTLRYARLRITNPGIDNYARIPEFEIWGAVPPVADFTADKTGGTSPLTVQFTDQSAGTITSRLWDFGDGDQSTAVCPSHVYETPGVYTVSLTVTGPAGSDTKTKTDYIAVRFTAGASLLRNAGFAEGLAHWMRWTERDAAGNFTAAVVDGRLQCTGSNYNGGVYQQFLTGGAGQPIVVSGYWKSQPVLAGSQWGEIIIINSARLPTDGVDETPANRPDDVLIFKNDTWTSPGGWDGAMSDTSPVAHVGKFIAAADRATILIKSGNIGAGLTGLVADDLDVRLRVTAGDLDRDTDVDTADFSFFQVCFNGPNRPPALGECAAADLDGDADVDLADFVVFQSCHNGPNRPPRCL